MNAVPQRPKNWNLLLRVSRYTSRLPTGAIRLSSFRFPVSNSSRHLSIGSRLRLLTGINLTGFLPSCFSCALPVANAAPGIVIQQTQPANAANHPGADHRRLPFAISLTVFISSSLFFPNPRSYSSGISNSSSGFHSTPTIHPGHGRIVVDPGRFCQIRFWFFRHFLCRCPAGSTEQASTETAIGNSPGPNDNVTIWVRNMAFSRHEFLESSTLSSPSRSGAFDSAVDQRVERFTESISFDHVLAEHDIRGSIAHARMLAAQKIISSDESRQIVEASQADRRRNPRGQNGLGPSAGRHPYAHRARADRAAGRCWAAICIPHAAATTRSQPICDCGFATRSTRLDRRLVGLQRAFLGRCDSDAGVHPAGLHPPAAGPAGFGRARLAGVVRKISSAIADVWPIAAANQCQSAWMRGFGWHQLADRSRMTWPAIGL